MNYDKKRNLDGVYFRVERNGKWENICFSDLTKEERNNVMLGKSEVWLRSLCDILADTIKDIGNMFDLVGGYRDD